MKVQVSTDVLMSHTSTCVESNLMGHSMLLLQHLHEAYKDQWPYRVCITCPRTLTLPKKRKKQKEIKKIFKSLGAANLFRDRKGITWAEHETIERTLTQHDRSKLDPDTTGNWNHTSIYYQLIPLHHYVCIISKVGERSKMRGMSTNEICWDHSDPLYPSKWIIKWF